MTNGYEVADTANPIVHPSVGYSINASDARLQEWDLTPLSGDTHEFTVIYDKLFPAGTVVALYVGDQYAGDVIYPSDKITASNLLTDGRTVAAILVVSANGNLSEGEPVGGLVKLAGVDTTQTPFTIVVDPDPTDDTDGVVGNTHVYDANPPGYTFNATPDGFQLITASAATYPTDNGVEVIFNDEIAASRSYLTGRFAASQGLWVLFNVLADDDQSYVIRYKSKTFANGLAGLDLDIPDSPDQTIVFDLAGQLSSSYNGAGFVRVESMRVKGHCVVENLVFSDTGTATSLVTPTPTVVGNEYGQQTVGQHAFSAATGNILGGSGTTTTFELVSGTNVNVATWSINASTGAYTVESQVPGAASVTWRMLVDSVEIGTATDTWTAVAISNDAGQTIINEVAHNLASPSTALKNKFGYAALPALPITIPSKCPTLGNTFFNVPTSFNAEQVVSDGLAATFLAACNALKSTGGRIRVTASINEEFTLPASMSGPSNTNRIWVQGMGIDAAKAFGRKFYCEADNYVFYDLSLHWARFVGSSNVTNYKVNTNVGSVGWKGSSHNVLNLGCKGGAYAVAGGQWAEQPAQFERDLNKRPLHITNAYCSFVGGFDKAWTGVSSADNHPLNQIDGRHRHYRCYYEGQTDEVLSIKSGRQWFDESFIHASGKGHLSIRAGDDVIVTNSIVVGGSFKSFLMSCTRNHCHYNIFLARSLRGGIEIEQAQSVNSTWGGSEWDSKRQFWNNDIRYNIFGTANDGDITGWISVAINAPGFIKFKSKSYGGLAYPGENKVRDNIFLCRNNPDLYAFSTDPLNPDLPAGADYSQSRWEQDNPEARKSLNHFPSYVSQGKYSLSVSTSWPNSMTIEDAWIDEDGVSHNAVVGIPDHWQGANTAVTLN